LPSRRTERMVVAWNVDGSGCMGPPGQSFTS